MRSRIDVRVKNGAQLMAGMKFFPDTTEGLKNAKKYAMERGCMVMRISNGNVLHDYRNKA